MRLRRILKRVLTAVLSIFVGIPLLYGAIAVVSGYIPTNRSWEAGGAHEVFIATNGVHLHLIFHRSDLPGELEAAIPFTENEAYCTIGWGDARFYRETPTWADLKLGTALEALFMPSPSLMHVGRYAEPQSHWLRVEVSKKELNSLIHFVDGHFSKNGALEPMEGYGPRDHFYTAEGHYTLFFTCNTWVNKGLRQAGMPAVWWTPFDFPLMRIYQRYGNSPGQLSLQP